MFLITLGLSSDGSERSPPLGRPVRDLHLLDLLHHVLLVLGLHLIGPLLNLLEVLHKLLVVLLRLVFVLLDFPRVFGLLLTGNSVQISGKKKTIVSR